MVMVLAVDLDKRRAPTFWVSRDRRPTGTLALYFFDSLRSVAPS